MRRRRSVLGMAPILALALGGCGILTPGDVEVRVENASPVAFGAVTISPGPRTGPLEFGPLEPGDASAYVQVSSAYRVATTDVVIEADTLHLQVVDYVGEEPLEGGRYTYVLDVRDADSGDPHLTQELRRER